MSEAQGLLSQYAMPTASIDTQPRPGSLGGYALPRNRFPAGLESELRANVDDWVHIEAPGVNVVIAEFKRYFPEGKIQAHFRTQPIQITVVP